MILAIDVGNTNIVVGCIDKGEILNTFRIRTDVHQTSFEYAVKFKEILDIFGIDTKSFDGAILSSVAPPINEALINAVKTLTGLDCRVVGPGMKTGINICIDDPGTLAGDLLTGSVAAAYYYGVPSIVIDMGTATTIFAVDGKKRFIGGAIMPGINISYSALSSGTSLLPHISITPPAKAIGTNTVDCMRSGAVFGNAAMIDGMIERMEAEIGEKCLAVATGGLGGTVTKCCRHEIIHDDNLILKGLWLLYEKNK